MESLKVCRICFDSGHQKKMISPCECRGTSQYVHIKCLSMWMRTNGSTLRCEVCRAKYNLAARPIIESNRKFSFSHILSFESNVQLIFSIIVLLLCFSLINIYYILLNGSLQVTIHRAHLPDMDLFLWSRSDAYVVVCVDEKCSCETQVHNDNNSPQWNHVCNEWQNSSIPFNSKITFLVYDADDGNSDDLIGGITMTVYQVVRNGYNDKDVHLRWEYPHPGSLMIKISWMPPIFRILPRFF